MDDKELITKSRKELDDYLQLNKESLKTPVHYTEAEVRKVLTTLLTSFFSSIVKQNR